MWRSLGTLKPQMDWRTFNAPTFSDTFRITYTGLTPELSSTALIRQYFANDEVSPATRLYPKREKLILELPIPEPLKNSGMVVRYIGVKRLIRRRYGFIWPDSDWSLTLEELI
ncbi:hypothetical protein NDA01_03585 [Trichocoleus desertorum AS-A10]|uniref:hypothetical protein n=1 Tax=Trichocoleus desertorum TaxID=1481672 RepID=UPI0032973479